MAKLLSAVAALMLLAGAAGAAVLAEISLASQVDLGMGDAITRHEGFGEDGGFGYVERRLTAGNGAGSWYWGPNVDLVKAGYGPHVDLSKPGARIEYTARYFQGDGNTNPYSDAPVFLEVVDADGERAWLGISYGPQPDPTYPEWITVTDDLSNENPSFDASRVVEVNFFGTDWEGTGNDFVQVRKLRLLDDTQRNPIPIPSVKGREDGEEVEVTGAVSASFTSLGRFYLQNEEDCCGIQVRFGSVPGAGPSVYVKGTVQTDPETLEMYIDAASWSPAGAGAARPRLMTTSTLGGSDLFRQTGVAVPLGPNNVGLLVRIAGELTAAAADRSWMCVDDGAGLSYAGNPGVRVSLRGIQFWQRPALNVGNDVRLTGICSLGPNGSPTLMLAPGGLTDLESDENEPKTIRALVVNFDPYCPGHGNLRTHEVFGWNDPHDLAEGYMTDLMNTSGEWCDYEIVNWFDADYHPFFEDGYQWDPDAYVTAWQTQTGLHEGTSDYIRLVTDKTYPHNQPKSIAERVADDEIDEVFFFGAPAGFAGWESAMAGPNPFFVNGGTYWVPTSGRNFVMMGFNYERGVDCMLENFLHRSECTMSRVYPSPSWWFPTYPPINNWERFRMIDIKGAGESAVGMCHFAPNSESDYDWGNPRYVWSMCDDWLYNWPNLQGEITKRLVNCEEWGNGDMRLHHVWWLEHFPKAEGVNPDGKQNNWWKYVCDFNSYAESR